jgi:hypothetical protein
MATNLDNAVWQPIQTSLMISNVVLTPSNPGAFYRIQGK